MVTVRHQCCFLSQRCTDARTAPNLEAGRHGGASGDGGRPVPRRDVHVEEELPELLLPSAHRLPALRPVRHAAAPLLQAHHQPQLLRTELLQRLPVHKSQRVVQDDLSPAESADVAPKVINSTLQREAWYGHPGGFVSPVAAFSTWPCSLSSALSSRFVGWLSREVAGAEVLVCALPNLLGAIPCWPGCCTARGYTCARNRTSSSSTSVRVLN